MAERQLTIRGLTKLIPRGLEPSEGVLRYTQVHVYGRFEIDDQFEYAELDYRCQELIRTIFRRPTTYTLLLFPRKEENDFLAGTGPWHRTIPPWASNREIVMCRVTFNQSDFRTIRTTDPFTIGHLSMLRAMVYERMGREKNRFRDRVFFQLHHWLDEIIAENTKK